MSSHCTHYLTMTGNNTDHNYTNNVQDDDEYDHETIFYDGEDLESHISRRMVEEDGGFWECLFRLDCDHHDEKSFAVFMSIVRNGMLPPFEFDTVREQYMSGILDYTKECADTHHPEFTFVNSEELTLEQIALIGLESPRITGPDAQPLDRIVIPIPNGSNRVNHTILSDFMDTGRLPPFTE